MKTGPEYLNSATKRRLDIAGALNISLPAGLLAAPAWITTALENGFSDALYRQTRLQGNGTPFEIVKFRTLPPGSDKSPATFGTYDPRASKLALFLRRYGLDEIPQLRNVLNGSMSLIGVRAHSEDTLNQLQMTEPALFDTWYEEAYAVAKPALIGVGNVHYRQHQEWSHATEEGMLKDLEYISKASVREDLKFLGSLPFKVLAAKPQAEAIPIPPIVSSELS